MSLVVHTGLLGCWFLASLTKCVWVYHLFFVHVVPGPGLFACLCGYLCGCGWVSVRRHTKVPTGREREREITSCSGCLFLISWVLRH